MDWLNRLKNSQIIIYRISRICVWIGAKQNNCQRHNGLPQNTLYVIKQICHSMYVMIAILMSPRDPVEVDVDGYVNIFLSCCHQYFWTYHHKKESPFWTKTGNFPTLLCLVEQRNHHEPARWYWEGTSEQYIQQLKKHLIPVRKSTPYFTGKPTFMHTSVTLDWIKHMCIKPDKEVKRDHCGIYYIGTWD